MENNLTRKMWLKKQRDILHKAKEELNLNHEDFGGFFGIPRATMIKYYAGEIVVNPERWAVIQSVLDGTLKPRSDNIKCPECGHEWLDQ